MIVCIGLGAGVVYIKGSEDNEGPKITFSEDKDTKYTSGMTTEDLLKDVRAQDNKDGDVTDSLTVETMYPKNDGKQITVIFVAKDKSNNVTKKEFTMEGTVLDKLSYVKDIQDDTETTSDLFKKIQITGDVNTATPGTYELTYYVVDNQGNSSNGAILTVVVK